VSRNSKKVVGLQISKLKDSFVPGPIRRDNAHTQIEVTTGEVVIGSAWLIFYVLATVLGFAGQSLGHWIELSAHY
jgi:hypothetical protein